MHLFIQSFGAKLAVRNGLFEVTTIENQQYLKHEYAPDELTELWVQNGCSITTAAIHLAMENDIDLLILNHFGMPMGRFMPIRPSSIISIQRGQLMAAQNKMGLELVKSWIGKKMDNQAMLLTNYCQNHRSSNANKVLITKHIEQIKKYKNNLEAIEAAHVTEVADTLRGMEGSAGRAYFSALRQIIPERYDFSTRTYQHSEDFFNTCLNYAYAILYSKVESALSKAGLNPYAGFLHRDEHQHLSMVYDFVEPYRVWAEEVVFGLIVSKSVANAHFEKQENGVLWLSAMGKKYLSNALLTMLREETVTYEVSNQAVKKEHLLLLHAQNLATQLKPKVVELIQNNNLLEKAA